MLDGTTRSRRSYVMSTCRIDWRTIFPEDSFIHKYMTVASQDTVPEEYHLWCALLVLGLILGHKVTLKDNPEVYGNLYICMLGRPGAGKSRATRLARALLEEVAPFSQTTMSIDGVRLIKQPASGEVLI